MGAYDCDCINNLEYDRRERKQKEQSRLTALATQSTDLIDRQQAINGKIVIQRTNGVEIYSDEAVPVEYLKALPPAQPKRKKGEWIPHKSVFGGLGEKVYTCNQCGYNIGFHAENYCSNCGADMRGERDEID